jgi:hypothetical protein
VRMGGGWKWPRIVPTDSVESSGTATGASVILQFYAVRN